MKIISQRNRVENVEYGFHFQWRDSTPNHGFSFPCDKDGNILKDKMNEAGLENYKKCITGVHDVISIGVKAYEWAYTEPAVGECNCGEEVVLDGFTNTCESCDRDFNMSGQELASRDQWCEGTSDHLSDILRIK